MSDEGNSDLFFLERIRATEKQKELVLKLKDFIEGAGEPKDEVARHYLSFKTYYQLLVTNKWDVKKSSDSLMKILSWRRGFRPDQLTANRINFINGIKKPLVYLHGNDKQGRPFCWVNLYNAITYIKNDDNGEKKFDLLVYCAEVLQNIIRKSPGIFNGTIVVDAKGIGIGSVFKIEKFGHKFFQIVDNYQNCLYRAYLVNAGFFLKAAFMVGKKWWDPNLLEKYETSSKSKDLLKIANKDQIVKYFGGSSRYEYHASNITPEKPIPIRNSSGFDATFSKPYDREHTLYQLDNNTLRTAFAFKDSNDQSNFFQMNLYEDTLLKGIILQGRGNTDQWVTRLAIDVCDPHGKWTKLGEFEGTKDRDTKTEVVFKEPVLCKFVRLHSFKFHGHCSFRVGLLK